MGIFSALKEVFSDPPPGPEHDVNGLEHHSREYVRHVMLAHDTLEPTLCSAGYELLAKDRDGSVMPHVLLSDIRYEHMPDIRSWTEDEFVPKIRAFSSSRARAASVASSEFSIDVPDVGKVNELTVARLHLDAARRHGAEVLSALSFFLCDTRSPFDKRAALGNDVTASESASWWIGGKRIVEKHMKAAEGKLERYLDFAWSAIRRG